MNLIEVGAGIGFGLLISWGIVGLLVQIWNWCVSWVKEEPMKPNNFYKFVCNLFGMSGSLDDILLITLMLMVIPIILGVLLRFWYIGIIIGFVVVIMYKLREYYRRKRLLE